MLRTAQKNRGFTLVELLIVVIILAILAAIVIPQFASSTEEAKLSSLQTNLSSMRGTIELYYTQHGQRYPGAYKETDGTTATDSVTAPPAFIAQLTQYTDVNGKVNTTKTATYKYGPYLKSTTLPKNPFKANPTEAVALVADTTTTDITTASAVTGTTTGWKFYVAFGRFIANDGTTLSDGTTTVSQ